MNDYILPYMYNVPFIYHARMRSEFTRASDAQGTSEEDVVLRQDADRRSTLSRYDRLVTKVIDLIMNVV